MSFECTTDADCFSNGQCDSDGSCTCNPFYFEDDCSLNGVMIIGSRNFHVWVGFIVLFYGLIMVYSVRQVVVQIRRKRVPWSAQNICLCFTALLTLSRIIYFLCDPWDYRQRMPFVAANYLRNIAIPFILTMYLLVLIVWIEIYHGKSKITPGRILGSLRPVFFVSIIITYALFFAAIPFYNTSDNQIVYVWAAWLVVFFLFLSIGFTVYGVRLYRRLSGGIVVVSKKHKQTLTKLTRFAVSVSVTCIVAIIVVIGLTLAESSSSSSEAKSLLAGYTISYIVENVFCWLVILTLRTGGGGGSDSNSSYSSFQGTSSGANKGANSFKESAVH